MGSVVIVVSLPCADNPPCVFQGVEQVFVQAFISQPAIEALDKSVLHRLAGRDVMPTDAARFAPFQNGV